MRFDSSGWGTEVLSGTCSPAEFVRSEGSLHSRLGLQSSSMPIDTLKAGDGLIRHATPRPLAPLRPVSP